MNGMTPGSPIARRSVLKRGAALTVLAALPALPAAALAQTGDPESWLDAFFEEAYRDALSRSPEWETMLGLNGAANDRWNEVSEAFDAESHKLEVERLARMRAEVDPAGLSDRARMNYRLWEYRAEENIAAYRWRNHDYVLEHFNGRHSGMPSLLINSQPVRDPGHFAAWEARVGRIGSAVDQLIAAAERQACAGVIPPRFSLEKSRDAVLGTLRGRPFQKDATEDSALLADIKAKIEGMDVPAGEKAELSARAEASLERSFGPAYRRLADHIGTLHARATDDDGVWKLPDGAEFYRFCLKRHTTLELDPDEVHARGLAEVARIHGEMQAIMRQVGWSGDLQSFFRHLREDPRFYYPDTPEGHAAYLAEAERILAEVQASLDGQFGIKPKAPVIVRRFEPFREASEAIARYSPPAADGSRPGTYYVNFSNMREMARFQMESLAFHEAVPGHHLQIAIAQEMTDLPTFRRFDWHNAYVEGWALYSERLPKEMGFYKDPYADFGRLTFELWRAIRLVVDTGIHAKRWTRQEAIDYFAGNSAVPPESAEREIDRYIVWPGQACGYYLGLLKILELRGKAETALADRFDIRGFHDAILRNGSVPLPILEDVVADWVASRRA